MQNRAMNQNNRSSFLTSRKGGDLVSRCPSLSLTDDLKHFFFFWKVLPLSALAHHACLDPISRDKNVVTPFIVILFYLFIYLFYYFIYYFIGQVYMQYNPLPPFLLAIFNKMATFNCQMDFWEM